MKGLSTIERVILETLNTDGKSLNDIQFETGLSSNVTFNLLQALIIRGLVAHGKNGYHVGKHIPQEVIEKLNAEDARRSEALELVSVMAESTKTTEFKMRKVYLEGTDEKIFKSLLIQMEGLLNDASKKKKGNLKDSKVVFWAVENYGTLIQRMMEG